MGSSIPPVQEARKHPRQLCNWEAIVSHCTHATTHKVVYLTFLIQLRRHSLNLPGAQDFLEVCLNLEEGPVGVFRQRIVALRSETTRDNTTKAERDDVRLPLLT